MRIKSLIIIGLICLAGIVGCSTDANLASRNISKDAENFKIFRRVVFLNGITDSYPLEVTGFCSIEDAERKLMVTCKAPDGIRKHYLRLSDNMSYFVEQLDPAQVSTNHYKVIFNPSVIIPSIEVR